MFLRKKLVISVHIMNYKIYQYTFVLITTLIIFLALNFLSKKANFIKSKKDYFIVLSFVTSDHLSNDERILNYVIHNSTKEDLLVQTVENNRGFTSVKYKFEINNKDQDIIEKFKKNFKYVEQNKQKILDTYLDSNIQKTINHLNLKLVKDFDLNRINKNHTKLSWENLKCSKLYVEANKYDEILKLLQVLSADGVEGSELAKLEKDKNEVSINMGLAKVCKSINDLETLLYIKSNKLNEDILITTMIEYDKQLFSDVKEIENKDLTEKTLSYYLKAFIFLIIGFFISQLFWILILQLKLNLSKK